MCLIHYACRRAFSNSIKSVSQISTSACETSQVQSVDLTVVAQKNRKLYTTPSKLNSQLDPHVLVWLVSRQYRVPSKQPHPTF